MKYLSDEEKKKLYKKLQDDINDAIAHGQLNWTSSVPTPRYSPNFQSKYPAPSGSYGYGTASPTDKNSPYPYQEPEVDEQGTLYGYKVLIICACGCGKIRSPRYPAKWNENGELQADREPSEITMYGIHCTKRYNHPELANYMLNDYYFNPYYSPYTHEKESILVKCALSGTVVETDQGYRAQHAQIISVLLDGYWVSYEDYKKYTEKNRDKRNYTYTWTDDISG